MLKTSLPILLIDDDKKILGLYCTILKLNGFDNLVTCSDSRELSSLLAEQKFEVMVLDLIMPNVQGEDVLLNVRKNFPEMPVIVITGKDDASTIVGCMKAGAFDYIVKPVSEDILISSIKKALKFRDVTRENNLLTEQILSGKLEHPEVFSDIITNNSRMKAIFQYIEAIAKTNLPVLITGETGVGKELIAKAVHKTSVCKGEFVPVNVGGLDAQLFADTLFGHKAGAYTGANSPRKGMVEKASGGTLFLDEIGELSEASQIKLLRLLEEREYYPLGQDNASYIDARIVVATNKNLESEQTKSTFRKDLYYRLKTHHVHIPTLKERVDDIPLLANYFFEKAAKELGKPKPKVSNKILSLLLNYQFPGNVRELKAIIYNAISLPDSDNVLYGSLKRSISKNGFGDTYNTTDKNTVSLFSDGKTLPTLKEIEDAAIKEALKQADDNKTLAANILGVSRQTLIRRLKQINADVK